MKTKSFLGKRKRIGKDPPWTGRQAKCFFVMKRHLCSHKTAAGIISQGQLYKRKEAMI